MGGAVFAAEQGLHFVAAGEHWVVEPFRVSAGNWLALVPENRDPAIDPSVALARILGTLARPAGGHVELLGKRVDRVVGSTLRRLRAEVGYVHGSGGLLSNRSIRDNVGLPLSVHKRVREAREGSLVDELLDELELTTQADKRPHELSGASRRRACLARAVALDPCWVVIEGGLTSASLEWDCLVRRRERYRLALGLCLPRESPGLERWFREQGGEIVRYSRAPRVRPTVRPS